MTTRTLFIIWVCAASFSAYASSTTDRADSSSNDPVTASFEREFGHESPQPKPVTRDDIDSDILYQEINTPLQSPENDETRDQGAQS